MYIYFYIVCFYSVRLFLFVSFVFILLFVCCVYTTSQTYSIYLTLTADAVAAAATFAAVEKWGDMKRWRLK